MHVLVETIFAVLFPKSKNEQLIDSMSSAQLWSLMELRNIHGTVTLFNYRNPVIRALIHEAKFHHNQNAIQILGTALDSYLTTTESSNSQIIVPIPLSGARMRARGYNQVAEILKATTLTSLPIEANILVRKRNTAPQTDTPREKRKENVAGAFVVKKPELVASKHILLIDDVVTTGATLTAAKAALLPHHPASITCVALTH